MYGPVLPLLINNIQIIVCITLRIKPCFETRVLSTRKPICQRLQLFIKLLDQGELEASQISSINRDTMFTISTHD